MSFAPGHISLTFAIHDHVDPLKMGSTGLGIVLPQGVYCSIVNENRKGIVSGRTKKGNLVLVTRTCPPGVALVGPDMTEGRVWVKFRMFRIQNLFFEAISQWFCMVLCGEAQKTLF